MGMRATIVAAACLLSACGQDGNANVPGDAGDTRAFAGIPEGAVINLTGTEPFWGGRVEGGWLTYTTPENMEGQRLSVTRFAGRGGLSFSGLLEGEPVDLAVTPATCQDGMSERTYPYVATLQIGDTQRHGCAWVAGQELQGGEPDEP